MVPPSSVRRRGLAGAQNPAVSCGARGTVATVVPPSRMVAVTVVTFAPGSSVHTGTANDPRSSALGRTTPMPTPLAVALAAAGATRTTAKRTQRLAMSFIEFAPRRSADVDIDRLRLAVEVLGV